MKRHPKTGEPMAESVEEASKYMRKEQSGEKFRAVLDKALKGNNAPITSATPLEMHLKIIKSLKKTPDTPDINKVYKYLIATMSTISMEGGSKMYAYNVISHQLNRSIDEVIQMEKEAVKVIAEANRKFDRMIVA